MYLFELTENISFREETTGYHHGQLDGVLWAYSDNIPIGYIEWSKYQDETQIQMIEVKDSYRRKGIGTALVRELERTHDKVVWSMMTPDGSELYKSMGYLEPSEYPKVLYSDMSYAWAAIEDNDFSEIERYSSNLSPEVEVHLNDENNIDHVVIYKENLDVEPRFVKMFEELLRSKNIKFQKK